MLAKDSYRNLQRSEAEVTSLESLLRIQTKTKRLTGKYQISRLESHISLDSLLLPTTLLRLTSESWKKPSDVDLMKESMMLMSEA